MVLESLFLLPNEPQSILYVLITSSFTDMSDHVTGEGDHVTPQHHDTSSYTSSVGTALTCGFIFMLLVDQIGGAHGGHSHGAGFTEYIDSHYFISVF